MKIGNGLNLAPLSEFSKQQNYGNYILAWEERLSPNPILKVLFTLKKHHVKCLLIGGQACISYGAAEFSRDSDFLILNTPENIEHLKLALKELRAELIYVPELSGAYLQKGHACHFRCNTKDVRGLRIDVLSTLKGCDHFEKLWKRRKRVSLKGKGVIDVISLYDLVESKKTQRDKDWLMLRRLVDNDIILKRYKAKPIHINWWLRECGNLQILITLVKKYPELAKQCAKSRNLLYSAISDNITELKQRLKKEEDIERKKDKEYWDPLRKELENLRHKNLG